MIIDAIRGIRNARAKMNIPPSKKAPLYIITDTQSEGIYRGNEDSFIKMASCESVEIRTEDMEMDNALTVVTGTARCLIPMDSLIDREKEIARLTREKERLGSEIARIRAKLANEGFTSKAPEKVVAAEREKLENYMSLLSDIEAGLAAYTK